MNNSKIRLRLAPSPTGFLHIGNLRTALFSYLIAKKLGAQFILRIEDTDQKREVEGAVESLVKILDWVGINFDEGPHLGGDYGPYIQSERLSLYQKYAEELIEKGEAYYCFCTAERLDKMRAEQEAQKMAPRYDRACHDLSLEEARKKIAAGEKYVIRQKMPLSGEVKVYDEMRGEIVFKAAELDDQVLLKSDGFPTYQLASVVDDHLMEITHVTRGAEWLPSYPKNILLYQSLGWTAPKFFHFPLILNKGGGKLSKRQGDVFVEDYRSKGYLPEAIINFCALLGWHPDGDKETLNFSEIIENFSIKNLGISPAVFDLDKLDFYNGYYIRQKNDQELTKLCLPYLEKYVEKINDHEFKIIACEEVVSLIYLEQVIALSKDRMKKLSDIVELSEFFFKEKLDYEASILVWKKSTAPEAKNKLQELKQLLENTEKENWSKLKLEEIIVSYIKEKEGKNGDYLWPLRVALTGREASPSPFEVAEVLGKKESLARIEQAIIKL